MPNAIALFELLEDNDVDWLVDNATEKQYPINTKIIAENAVVTDLCIILEGTCNVFIERFGNKSIAMLGPGEIIGEMSFIENEPASASVIAIEDIRVLLLPLNKVQQKLSSNAEFSSRFYQALAKFVSHRLRHSVRQFEHLIEDRITAERTNSPHWKKAASFVRQFKDLVSKAETAQQNNQYSEADALYEEIAENNITGISEFMHTNLSDIDESLRNEIGKWMKNEFLPYILLSETIKHATTKPRGYAGDYLIIKKLCDKHVQNENPLGNAIDKGFLKLPCAHAVVNRRKLIANEILSIVNNAESTIKITVLASGPAMEIFDVFEQLDDPKKLVVTCVDIDLQALAYVADLRDKRNLKRQIHLINESLVYLATGRQKIKLENQDMIYSMGLIDYFSDKFVTKLMNFSFNALKEGGRCLLGNYHTKTQDQGYMKFILDWNLIYRDENDMNRLYQASKFGKPSDRFLFEEQNIDMFAECSK